MTDRAPASTTPAEATEGVRLPMRGIVIFTVEWRPEKGWALRSNSKYGAWKDWAGPDFQDASVYTNFKAMQFEEGWDLPLPDRISWQPSADGEGYVIDAVDSYCIALVTAPPDARVGTVSFRQFNASEIRVRNFARENDRVAFTPLRRLLESGVTRLIPHWVDGTRVDPDPAKPIVNLHEFDRPPIPAIAERWGAKIKPLEFIESTPELTTRVSRVPAFKTKWGLRRFDLTLEQDQDDWTGYPEWEAAKEVVGALPEIMNEADDPAVVDWALNVCLKPLLPYRWDTPNGSMTGRKYVRERLHDIERPDRRALVADIINGPLVRGFDWDYRVRQDELL